MRIWPRRKPALPPTPVVLPSLDRLAGLIERVVELVDEVSSTPAKAPERPPGAQPALPAAPPAVAQPAQPVPPAAAAAADGSWLAFVPSPEGYQLVVVPGAPPDPGRGLDVNGHRYRVLRHAPSPLPGDRRRCAVVEMEEPPEADRSFDA